MTVGSVNSNNSDVVVYVAVDQKAEKTKQAEEKIETTSTKQTDTVAISAEARRKYDDSIANTELGKVNTTQSVEQARYATRETKDAEGARFDAILKELRGKYSEQEAISRFNDIMCSEGYEVFENVDDSTKYRSGASINGANANGVGYLGGSIAFLKGRQLVSLNDVQDGSSNSYSSGNTVLDQHANMYAHASSFNTASVLNGSMMNGEMKYTASTWASYNASINITFDNVADFWKSRNVDELSAKAGFDVGEYVNNMSSYWGKAFAAESVSSDLANIVSDMLSKAGIILESGSNVNLSFNSRDGKNIGLTVDMDFGDDALRDRLQSIVDDEVSKNPGILAAFEKENNSVEQFDVGKLDGAYANGVQSNQYIQERQFIMSGDQPSAVVMGSGLDSVQKGYTYIKKISNSFDPAADIVELRGNDYTVNSDPQEYARMKQLAKDIRDERYAE